MLVDTFTFFNELELLEFRLRLLYEHVDLFVIVEGDKTFSGKDKPFYFEQAQERFGWANSKIQHHKAKLSVDGLALNAKPADYDADSAFFNLEYQQRDAIKDACAPLKDNHIVMLSDVDEIPSIEIITALRRFEGQMFDPLAFEQRLFFYNLGHEMVKPWRGTVAAPLGTLRATGAQQMRHLRTQFPYAPGGGWHLTYFGNPAFIANKIDSFAHQEFNHDEFKDENHLENCIKQGLDPFGRDEIVHFKKTTRDSFPEYFLKLADANPSFFFQEEEVSAAGGRG